MMTEQEAFLLWTDRMGTRPDAVVRFQTGLCHYVFLISQGDERAVLRVASEENRSLLKANVDWLSLLGGIGAPVPKVRLRGDENDPPFLVLEYLQGDDLGSVYDTLTESQRAAVAKDLVAAHRHLDGLPRGPGYGFLSSYSDPKALPTWRAVLEGSLSRSKERIRTNKVFEPGLVDAVEVALDSSDTYFRSIEPRPFFDDATTKNLLVHDGRLSGIVDLDWLCFGDRLFALALTRMSLLARGSSQSYIDFWASKWGVEGPLNRVLDLYTLIFCLDFMGEIGMRFNKDSSPAVDPIQVSGLLRHYDSLSSKLGWRS